MNVETVDTSGRGSDGYESGVRGVLRIMNLTSHIRGEGTRIKGHGAQPLTVRDRAVSKGNGSLF